MLVSCGEVEAAVQERQRVLRGLDKLVSPSGSATVVWLRYCAMQLLARVCSSHRLAGGRAAVGHKEAGARLAAPRPTA